MTLERHLAHLTSAGLVRLGQSEPELEYLFRHALTQEATYASLLKADRQVLHKAIAETLLALYPDQVKELAPVLAHHYHFAYDVEGERHYTRLAAEHFAARYANAEAADYYGRLLALMNEGNDQASIHLRRGSVLELMGRFDEAEADYQTMLRLGEQEQDLAIEANAQLALGKLSRMRGDYEFALDWLARAKATRTALGDMAGLARVLIETGIALFRKGEYARAREPLNEGLTLAREAGDELNSALALNNLGIVSRWQGDYAAARVLYEASLAIRRKMGDKRGISASLNNLGVIAFQHGDYSVARVCYEEGLALRRGMGDKEGIAISLNNLGLVAMAEADYITARWLHEESLALKREMGDKWGTAISLGNLGLVAMAQADYGGARALFEQSLALCKAINDRSNMTSALLGLGLVDLAENKPEAREHILHSLRLRWDIGEYRQQASSLIGVAGLALREGSAHRAAQLLGAIDSALKVLNMVVEPEMKHFHTQTLAAARAALSADEFAKAWAEGQALTLEEAIALALRSNSP